MSDCTFTGNRGSSRGGAVLVTTPMGADAKKTTMSNCSFTDNSAMRGGAIGVETYGHVVLDQAVATG